MNKFPGIQIWLRILLLKILHEYEMMDVDNVSGPTYQEYFPSFIPSQAEVGFWKQKDEDVAALPLDSSHDE